MEQIHIYKRLMHDARYAYNSFSVPLVYQAYGASAMAWKLGAITKDEFYKLNDLLIRDSVNNGQWMRRATMDIPD